VPGMTAASPSLVPGAAVIVALATGCHTPSVHERTPREPTWAGHQALIHPSRAAGPREVAAYPALVRVVEVPGQGSPETLLGLSELAERIARVRMT
jgi:hypothetical protein